MTFVYRPRVKISLAVETRRVADVVAEHRAAALDRRMSYSNSSTCAQVRDVQAWERFGR